MPRPKPGRNAGTATTTPPPVVPVPAPLPAPTTAAEGESVTDRSGGLSSFGITRLEQEIAEYPERFRIIDIPLDDIVGNPYNPKHREEPNADKLADILPSVREFGVVEPALVCEREVLMHNSPQLDSMTKQGRYVTVAGARRRAASRLAGKTTIPGVVRNEYASARALIQIYLAENGGRLQLTALEEAEGYQLLVNEGMSYQQIVDTVGGTARSKGQVSKRLKLLQLTELGKELLNQDKISVDGALVLLSKLPGDPTSQDRALTAATTGGPDSRISLKAAIEQESRRIQQQSAAESARKQIAELGLQEINPEQRWGENAWQHRLATEEEVQAAKAAGDLAGVVIVDGRLQHYRENPPARESVADSDPEPPTEKTAAGRDRKATKATKSANLEATRIEQERRQAHHDASAARQEACRRMVKEFSDFRDSRRQALIEVLADAVLSGGTDKAVLRRPEVCQWTGSPVVTEYDLGEVLLQDRPEANRLAFATALAVAEAQATDDRYLGDRPWPPAVQRHIHRLVELGYHTLTPYEQDKLG